MSIQTSVLNQADKGIAYRIARAFLSADIPLSKLDNKQLYGFLTELHGEKIPSRRTVGRQVARIYEEKMESIRSIVFKNDVYFIIDESTDSTARKMVLVLIGVLNGDKSKPMLVCSKEVQKADNVSISRIFDSSCRLIFQENENYYDRVKLVVSDAASCMKLAFSNLKKTTYPRLIRVTCVVHCLHRVAEEIRDEFGILDRFISLMKKLLLKSPSRVSL